MRCPKCGSGSSEYVASEHEYSPLGGRHCLECNFIGRWQEFADGEVGPFAKPLSEYHERDREYFTEYPAPLMQLIQGHHFTNINSTITFFGPMLYFIARAMGCEQILEIGVAQGYSALYLASAVKDNAVRFGMAGNRYYGIDIIGTELAQENLDKYNLPATVMKLDSMQMTPNTFPGVAFDLIFQDGNHDTEHVLHEMKTMYPQLKGGGRGLWIFHDCYGPAEEGFREIEKLVKKGHYDFQYTCLQEIYGISIMRKMEGYDYEKRHWWDSPVGKEQR